MEAGHVQDELSTPLLPYQRMYGQNQVATCGVSSPHHQGHPSPASAPPPPEIHRLHTEIKGSNSHRGWGTVHSQSLVTLYGHSDKAWAKGQRMATHLDAPDGTTAHRSQQSLPRRPGVPGSFSSQQQVSLRLNLFP